MPWSGFDLINAWKKSEDAGRRVLISSEGAVELGRHHYRVTCLHHHWLHQVSNALVKTHDRYVLEDLHVAGMMKNHRMAAAIGDASWGGQLAQQLTYRTQWHGGTVVVADRWFP